ncbi:MAG: bifunctional heptose 7-phosphate kinase/heptose 1-phosphate adenyltransferase [Candidatus Kapaibacteriales bacterium]
MLNITLEQAKKILENCKGKRIAVIGDVMLDRFFWGNVSRISPEAPVPVVDLEQEISLLGGASNVANNLLSLGVIPLLCGVVGDDSSGKIFLNLAKNIKLDVDGFFIDKTRPTTVKTRIIGNNQHLVRIDRETTEPISDEAKRYIIDYLKSQSNLDGIIFQDYNKGTITKELIQRIIDFAKLKDIYTFVDPKFENFFEYQGVTAFKPNKKEAQQALGKTFRSFEDIIEGGKDIYRRLSPNYLLLTLGRNGMLLFESEELISHVPTRARKVADVTGAGDTAIATFSAAYVAGAEPKEAVELANFAAGVVCEEPGIVPVSVQSLLESIKENNLENSKI